jgi:hypothetical protein
MVCQCSTGVICGNSVLFAECGAKCSKPASTSLQQDAVEQCPHGTRCLHDVTSARTPSRPRRSASRVESWQPVHRAKVSCCLHHFRHRCSPRPFIPAAAGLTLLLPTAGGASFAAAARGCRGAAQSAIPHSAYTVMHGHNSALL